MNTDVSEILVKWYHKNKRDLPWRHTKSPYHIWISEIILQQTRVAQGKEYYNKFVSAYPTVYDLAAASSDELLKLWQGLGYYSRARNLHTTARELVEKYQGVFPEEYDQLLMLKGIGEYTAAAVASLAFNKPVPVIDGNVYRVLSRLFEIMEPIDHPSSRKIFKEYAVNILNHQIPGIHNQAIMEFGALLCLPRQPLCGICPLSQLCIAFKKGTMNQLPVKKMVQKVRSRYFNYLFIISGNNTFLHKRIQRDIWHSLYELPLIETGSPVSYNKLRYTPEWKALINNAVFEQVGVKHTYIHKLTHQRLVCNFYQLKINKEEFFLSGDFEKVNLVDISKFAVPRVIDRYFTEIFTSGNSKKSY